MGATDFITIGTGATLTEAFSVARMDAAHRHGHGGYTGTIAEKDSVVLIPVPPEWIGQERAYAIHLIEDCDPRIDDKRGPAGALTIGPNRWLFFGSAPS